MFGITDLGLNPQPSGRWWCGLGPVVLPLSFSFLISVSIKELYLSVKFICFPLPHHPGDIFPRSGMSNNVQASSGSREFLK